MSATPPAISAADADREDVAPVPPSALDRFSPAAIAESDRVPRSAKLAFGAAGTAIIFMGHLPKTLANPVLVSTLGCSPASVSAAMFVFRIYEAFIGPVMGWISDNTRTRWGRRRPFMFVGAILTGAFLPVMWMLGRGWSPTLLIGWFIGCGLILYTFSTVFSIPYESLNLELTPDYNERTSVQSYKAFFQKLGGLVIGWAWYITQLPIFADAITGKPDILQGAVGLSIVVGVVVILVGLIGVFFVKERYYAAASRQPKVRLRDNFKYTLSNRPFMRLVALTVCTAASYYLSGGIAFFLRLYWVTGNDPVLSAKMAGVESTLSMILGIASIPVFLWLSNRFGKTRTMMIALGLTAFGIGSNWWTCTPDHPWWSITNSLILSPSLTGVWQLLPAMSADIVDHDELRTGDRREGAFASIYSWFIKASFTLGMSIAGPIVVLCGFATSAGSHQTPETIFWMRVCFAVLPTILLVTAMILLLGYPLSSEKMGAIRVELEQRRGKF